MNGICYIIILAYGLTYQQSFITWYHVSLGYHPLVTGLLIGCSVIVVLTGLPIGYSVMVALTGLPIGYSVIVALTDLPIGF